MSESSPAASAESVRSPYRWVMLGGLWFVYLSFGLVARSLAPVIAPVRDDLGLSQSMMGAVLGAWPFVYLAVAVPAGVFIDRFGLRRSLALGAGIVAASGFLRSVSTDALTLFGAVAVFGLGGPLISSGAPKLISEWFDESERGLAMGVYITGPSFGSLLALLTANSVLMPLTGQRWRFTVAIYAAVAALSLVTWLIVSARAPVLAVGSVAKSRVGARVLLREPVIVILLVLTTGSFYMGHTMANWMVEILKDGGSSVGAASYLSAVPVAVGIVAALVIPRRATVANRVGLLAALFAIGGLGAAGVWSGGWATWAGIAFLGIMRGAANPLIMLLLMDAPRVEASNMGAAGGLYFTAGEIGGVLGPFVTGVLADQSGGFGLPVGVLACLGAALSVATLVTGRRSLS